MAYWENFGMRDFISEFCFFPLIFTGILGQLTQTLFLPIFSLVLSVFVFGLKREDILREECRGQFNEKERKRRQPSL